MTEHKFFIHLYNRIITGKLKTFAELAEYAATIQTPFPKQAIVYKCFHLLKELRWGFFKGLNKKIHTRLWKELVIPHRDYPDAGDLKRNNSIGKVYIALLDIHGYTRFCQESKKNLSQLHALDDFMNRGTSSIGNKYSALCRRERGDEVLIVAGTATDILSTTLGIIASFSRKVKIRNEAVFVNTEDYSISLPDFEISAGIAGGNTETPLVISETGNLSGFLINMAARLQSRANKLSPHRTRIMVANTVQTNFLKENAHGQSRLYACNQLTFLHTGPIRFKGVRISLYDMIFQDDMRYKKDFEEQIEKLLSAQKLGHWQQLVFFEILALIEAAVKATPLPPMNVHFTKETIISGCHSARNHYAFEEDYWSAVTELGSVINLLKAYEGFDPLIVDYAEEVYSRYGALLDDYAADLEDEISRNLETVFPQENLRALWLSSRRNAEAYKKLLSMARKSKQLPAKKNLWYSRIGQNIENLREDASQKKF